MPTKLGQNFLRDGSVLEKIIEASGLKEGDFVIEIGPGEGVLTEKLASYVKKVIAIELDGKLSQSLAEKFKNNKKIEIINGDILKINLPEILKLNLSENYKVIANIPYYITSPIIRLFLEQIRQPQKMILMVQKEVAERIAAQPGKMSILAVAVQYYSSAEVLFAVSRKSFLPAPEVDSAVIKIILKNKFNKEKDKKFFRIVRSGFSAKRKTLLNNLSNGLQIDKKEVLKKLKTAGLSPAARAQELDIKDWERLTFLLN